MDTFAVQAISALLRRMTEGGATIFFSSHVMETVEKLCSRVAILFHGKIVAEGTVADVRAQSLAAPDATLEQVFFALTAGAAESSLPDWL